MGINITRQFPKGDLSPQACPPGPTAGAGWVGPGGAYGWGSVDKALAGTRPGTTLNLSNQIALEL
jgi:hypothetical protein